MFFVIDKYDLQEAEKSIQRIHPSNPSFHRPRQDIRLLSSRYICLAGSLLRVSPVNSMLGLKNDGY
jgi:hypothetical protein